MVTITWAPSYKLEPATYEYQTFLPLVGWSKCKHVRWRKEYHDAEFYIQPSGKPVPWLQSTSPQSHKILCMRCAKSQGLIW